MYEEVMVEEQVSQTRGWVHAPLIHGDDTVQFHFRIGSYFDADISFISHAHMFDRDMFFKNVYKSDQLSLLHLYQFNVKNVSFKFACNKNKRDDCKTNRHIYHLAFFLDADKKKH